MMRNELKWYTSETAWVLTLNAAPLLLVAREHSLGHTTAWDKVAANLTELRETSGFIALAAVRAPRPIAARPTNREFCPKSNDDT